MNDFTILHLSDLHISQEGSLLSLLMENLLKDIKKEMELVEIRQELEKMAKRLAAFRGSL